MFADLGKYGLLFPLPCFFNKQVQLTELLLQLSNGRAVHVMLYRANYCLERSFAVKWHG
ncbi:hypothetical protein EMIT0111MI5_280029 [Burkholderia sp. IT-111MI5]